MLPTDTDSWEGLMGCHVMHQSAQLCILSCYIMLLFYNHLLLLIVMSSMSMWGSEGLLVEYVPSSHVYMDLGMELLNSDQ